MKTFISTLCAILAAAVIIGAALFALARVNQWERELAFCYAQGESLNAEGRARENWIEMNSGLDARAKVELARSKLVAARQRLERAREIDRKVVTILENKPFWIPLTAQERTTLNEFKSPIAKNEQEHP
jgi:hypothetical protein